MYRLLIAVLGLLIVLPAVAQEARPRRTAEPIVIAHRGASGYRPEHTLAAYELAIKMGADYIEPDLVSTKDGVLVARHENALAIVDPISGALIERTTDIETRPEFAARKTTKVIDGVSLTGWFSEDLTLAELKTLRAVERIPLIRPQNTAYDGQYQVPTLQEVIDLAKRYSKRRGPLIGIYPETKHPTYFQSIGLPLEEPLVATLDRNNLRNASSPVFIQSFEVANLKKLSRMTRVPLVQLLNASGQPYDFVVAGDPRTYADLATPAGLREIATYAKGVGANKGLIVPRDANGNLLPPTTLIADAHAAGLLIHGWTFRSENTFLPTQWRLGADPAAKGAHAAEYALFFGLGIDGLFSDHSDDAYAAREMIWPGQE